MRCLQPFPQPVLCALSSLRAAKVVFEDCGIFQWGIHIHEEDVLQGADTQSMY